MVCRDKSEHWQVLGLPSDFIPRDCSYTIYSSVSHERDWIAETTACPFSCGSTCVYNVEKICDGTPDCPQGEDEGDVCEPSVDCSFSYSNLCGYKNVGEPFSVWVRASYDMFIMKYMDLINRNAFYDKDNTTYGTYLMVYSRYVRLDPAIVETARLPEPLDQTRCLKFHLSITVPRNQNREARFVVVGVRDGQGIELLSLSGERNYIWEDMSVVVPSGAQSLRFIATKPEDSFMAIDDVQLTAGDCWTSTCAEDEFKCWSGPCVKNSSVCDNVYDCVDGSDEKNCDFSVSCDFETPFLCGYKNGSVANSWNWGLSSDAKSPSEHVLWVNGGHNQRAVLLSPSFTANEESCVYFRYMLSGDRQRTADWSSSLQVFTFSDHQKRLVWRLWLPSAGAWRLAQIPLRPETDGTVYWLSFESDLGRYYGQSVLLDDIKVTRGPCNINVTACGPGEFLCDTGECIQDRFVCDSIAHCPDRSDENRDCSEPLHPIRLVGGGYPTQGRVEILNAGRWGSICTRYFDPSETAVICRMLNYSIPAFGGGSVSFGIGPPFWTGPLYCRGDEDRLEKCNTDTGRWDKRYCSIYSLAGVVCVDPPMPGVSNFRQNNVRLVGNNGWEGRLEIYHDGEWGSVCNRDWDLNDAMVVCRMMGYGPEAEILSNHSRGSTRKIWMSNVNCRGIETRLENCRFSGWDSNRCNHNQDVGVRCLGGPGVAQETSPRKPSERIRLVGGAASNEGRVEVQFGQVWGTVCDDFVTQTEVNVTCRTLGYSGGGEKLVNAIPGSGQIWLDDLRCPGATTSLFSCLNSGIGVHNCDHLEDLAVHCY
ncbi:MAM and LDL-receptor class A domain-containing protein 1-like [Liolophura sinensis]|uniref:MAM and LDL-receptor class A domain-containing protein 1-like n=1 Tax=Liolophura sinensis TaxID=3198878 RepID=UPI00315956A9